MNFFYRHISIFIFTILFASCISSSNILIRTPNNKENTGFALLSGLFMRAPGDNHILEKDQVAKLLSLDKTLLLQYLQMSFDTMDCSLTGKIPSQYAIILSGVYGTEDFRHGINKAWQCDNQYSQELTPCEYYCSYKFALTYLDIIFRDKNPGSFQKEFYIENRIDKISDYLKNLTEAELIDSLENKNLRPDIPVTILKANAGTPTERIMEMNYKLAIYYLLGMKGRTIKSRDFLLKDMLVAYGHDVSGDAVVNFAEEILYQLAYRIKLGKHM